MIVALKSVATVSVLLAQAVMTGGGVAQFGQGAMETSDSVGVESVSPSVIDENSGLWICTVMPWLPLCQGN